MADIWVVSDTHFGHANIIGYCARPFGSVQEMDEALIAAWNAAVRPQDKIYHLGDVAMSQQALRRVMPRLNGHKRLVLGNHDDRAPMAEYARFFEKITVWRLFKPLLLTHVPVAPTSFGKAMINVHGHTHDRPGPPGPYLCACVEQTGYAPVPLESLTARAKELGLWQE